MAKKENRINIQVECLSCRKSGQPGVSRYCTEKNKKNTTARIELKKYCNFERKHTVHKEVK
jgi:large subunit ribosomal protein L33